MKGERVAIYLRVSTGRQALHDLSIPDQRNQIRKAVEQAGGEVVAEFVEPGASATDDQRPRFQEMMACALAKPPEFTRIAVHSMSRLFRDEPAYVLYSRKLEKNGVRIISITQDFGEGAGGELARRVVALMDELQSAETAKHVRRTMLENARQGFWNGSAPPLGYRIEVAEIRGQKQKKKLGIDPEGSETIKLIFRLYLDGDGISGPLGIKNIVLYLNARGYKTPKGSKFHISYVGEILRDEVYVGRFWYNKRDSKLGVERPREEWIAVSVPPIIEEAIFQRVQTQLTLRSPAKIAPRLVNSSVLLSNLTRCGACGSPMMRQTGKGGRYQYYRCSGTIRIGSCTANRSTGINADILDKIVLDRLMDQLLTPERIQAIVAEITAKREAGADDAVKSLGLLREQRATTTKKLSRSYDLLTGGKVAASDTFMETLRQAEADVKRLADLIAAQEKLVDAQLKAVSREEASSFASHLREKLSSAAPAMKKRIIRSFVSQVVVSADEIVIVGAKSDLAEVVTGSR